MEKKIARLRSYGINIGDNCNIYCTLGNGRDSSLLSIGNNVTIAAGTIFLMHDNAIIKPTNGKYTDLLGAIHVGNNSFIGFGCIILPGVSIADNCIVGAGSVVTKSISQEGSVYAGNPARYICSVDNYVEKNHNYMVNLDNLSKKDVESLIKNSILLKR